MHEACKAHREIKKLDNGKNIVGSEDKKSQAPELGFSNFFKDRDMESVHFVREQALKHAHDVEENSVELSELSEATIGSLANILEKCKTPEDLRKYMQKLFRVRLDLSGKPKAFPPGNKEKYRKQLAQSELFDVLIDILSIAESGIFDPQATPKRWKFTMAEMRQFAIGGFLGRSDILSRALTFALWGTPTLTSNEELPEDVHTQAPDKNHTVSNNNPDTEEYLLWQRNHEDEEKI